MRESRVSEWTFDFAIAARLLRTPRACGSSQAHALSDYSASVNCTPRRQRWRQHGGWNSGNETFHLVLRRFSGVSFCCRWNAATERAALCESMCACHGIILDSFSLRVILRRRLYARMCVWALHRDRESL